MNIAAKECSLWRRFTIFCILIKYIIPVACESFGNRFCNGPCKQTPGSNDTFSCACPSDEFYFDAVQRICLYKTSCVTQKCSIGFCKDGRNKVFCHCEGIPYMTLNCKMQKFYQDECEERGGQALMPTRPAEGPRCACGEWAKADIENKKCVRKFSISSLVPMLICVFIEGIVNRNKRSWPILISRKFFSVPFITSPKPTSINEICTRNCMIVWATGFRQNIWSLMLTVGTAY